MNRRPFLLLLAPAIVFACSSSDTDGVLGPTPDAGFVDAGGPKRPPPNGDDDDVVGDDDDDMTTKDAGKDGDAPKDSGKDVEPPPPRKRVFVTKDRFNGDLKTAGAGADGLDGADKLCQKAATAANLGGTWVAWASSSTKNAIDRLTVDVPWYLVDRQTLVFDGKAELTGAPRHLIDTNETGTISLTGTGPLTNRVWTGTNNTGVNVAGKDCAEWTSAEPAQSAVAGTYVVVNGSRANWTRYAIDPNEACNKTAPIYCFEQ